MAPEELSTAHRRFPCYRDRSEEVDQGPSSGLRSGKTCFWTRRIGHGGDEHATLVGMRCLDWLMLIITMVIAIILIYLNDILYCTNKWHGFIGSVSIESYVTQKLKMLKFRKKLEKYRPNFHITRHVESRNTNCHNKLLPHSTLACHHEVHH